jgi:hypothetical protein
MPTKRGGERIIGHEHVTLMGPLDEELAMKSNYSNTARLKDLMTAPPMSAARHAEVMRKKIALRRMVEEAKDAKRADDWPSGKR